MADVRTEQPGEQDTKLRDVLALYAPLLAGLRAAAPVDRQVSLLVDEAVRGMEQAGIRHVPLSGRRSGSPRSTTSCRRRAARCGGCGGGRSSPTRWGWARPSRPALILAELRLRGLADRTLVITPAGLVTQWREELERKFGVPTVLASRDRMPRAGTGRERRPAGRWSPRWRPRAATRSSPR